MGSRSDAPGAAMIPCIVRTTTRNGVSPPGTKGTCSRCSSSKAPAQAGLAWITILRKREGYRRAFEDFDPERIARNGDLDRARLLADPGIVRNRLKIEAAIDNVRALLALRERGESLAEVLWGFVDDRPRQNQWRDLDEDLSDYVPRPIKVRTMLE